VNPEFSDSFIIETSKRLENHETRLSTMEHLITKIEEMTKSIERLATSMEHMASEQTEQGQRLQVLESRDGQMWQKVLSYAITAILSIAIGFIARSLGLQ
jgi:TolA-binding protein